MIDMQNEIGKMPKEKRKEMMNQIDEVMRSFGISDNGIENFWITSAIGIDTQTKAILDMC